MDATSAAPRQTEQHTVQMPAVRAATEADRANVLAIVTLAFVADPMTRWTIPNAERYLAVMPSFVEAFGGPGLRHGATFLVDGSGAALWLPPGVEPDSERMNAVMSKEVNHSILPDLVQVFEQMASFHPHEPHWYLPLIGVDPLAQGRGIGAALMRHATQRFDAEQSIAYLESSNPRNISLYERHGFEVLGTIQVGSSPVMTPMVRRPQ